MSGREGLYGGAGGGASAIGRSRPQIIGIVNVTEDSFSDGGRFLVPDAALRHARDLASSRADVIELGPAASHPGARPVSSDEEQRRLGPLLGPLVAEGMTLSVDSFRPSTHRYAATHGVSYLNDIQGFPDPLDDAVLESGCRLIVMHSIQRRGIAVEEVTDDEMVWNGLLRFFDERVASLVGQGVTADRLVIDPGLGFFLGATPRPSLVVLSRIGSLRQRFGLPVLISPSRKSFLRSLTHRSIERSGPATLAAELYAALEGVDYIRTHDVASLSDGIEVFVAASEVRNGSPRAAARVP